MSVYGFKVKAQNGSDEEIHSFCTGRYGITFPQFSKIDVLGDNADPLFKYLSENTTSEGFGASPITLILKGAVKKIEGWTVEDVESKLTGVLCGRRSTSCADQLAKAVRAAYEAEKQAS